MIRFILTIIFILSWWMLRNLDPTLLTIYGQICSLSHFEHYAGHWQLKRNGEAIAQSKIHVEAVTGNSPS